MMAIAEDHLHAVALGVEFDQAHAIIHQWCHAFEAKRAALRARALAAQFGVIELLFAGVRPAQAQGAFALRISHRQRVHCN
ncbi:hypothetical protein D3C78_1752790 [compost metagenome]